MNRYYFYIELTEICVRSEKAQRMQAYQIDFLQYYIGIFLRSVDFLSAKYYRWFTIQITD